MSGRIDLSRTNGYIFLPEHICKDNCKDRFVVKHPDTHPLHIQSTDAFGVYKTCYRRAK